jgi:myo-inositol 2-dehydrogenase/D-chiro-inositol 1-dehydrogenase
VDTVRVGLIGTGRIGSAHAEVVRDHPEVEQLVVADGDASRAAALADKLGVDHAPVEDTIGAVDAVVVAAATTAHAELIIAAARRGLPVFCEKPIAPDVASSVRVVAEVRATGVPTQIGFQRRFDAGYGAAREALRSGALGGLRRVHVVTGDREPPAADYIPTSGGIFRDCHVHDFDILRWVTGREVDEVYAVGANRGARFFADAGDVDESAAVLTLDDGTLVTLQGSRYNGGGHDVRMELAGTDATWVVGLDEHAPLVSAEAGVDFPGGTPWDGFWSRWTPAYVAEMNAFVELALGRRESPCTVDEALEAFYVAEAATLSRLQNRPVALAEVRTS